MTQNWRKLGLIHRPDTSKAWAANGYCHVPTPLVMGDTVRVYYASLDANNRGSIGFVDLDGDDLTKVKYVSPEPVLTPGPLGAFDCDGVVPSWTDGKILYYIGFQRCQSTPYMLYAGVALGQMGGLMFGSNGMLIQRDREAFSCGAPFMLIEFPRERIWYWSCTHWSDGHYNNAIKHISDGGKIDTCITPVPPDYAVGRPWVVKENGVYKMWYSIRRIEWPSYRMGYAESADGLDWIRKDDDVIRLNKFQASEAGIETAEYPAIVDSGGKRWMVYNGRQHGKDGILLAVLE